MHKVHARPPAKRIDVCRVGGSADTNAPTCRHDDDSFLAKNLRMNDLRW